MNEEDRICECSHKQKYHKPVLHEDTNEYQVECLLCGCGEYRMKNKETHQHK